MNRFEDKEFLYQFLPKDFEYLTKVKIVIYKEYKLKTDFLINIMHDLILKFYFSENQETKYNLWSSILRRKYGKYYNIYIQYLIDNKFMSFVSNYYAGKKSKSYKLNITILDIIRHKVNDKILLKKHKKDYLVRTFTSEKDSSIPLELRKKLIDDLYHVDIDYKKSYKWLNEAKDKKDIDLNQYMKNLSSIDGINSGYVFFKFDSYGRLHTNFTVLKKFIRQTYLTIDGENISELDISNSQPFFFAIYLKKEIGIENFNEEIFKYIDCVKNGLIYDELLQKYPELKNRNQAKILMYKVLFGKNIDSKKESKMFKSIYPTVYEYIKEFKSLSDSYKNLSHELQKLESNFIFNTVINEIKIKFPYIRLFTIHDSIVFPSKYKNEVELIFNSQLRKLQ